ncbi:MAG: hypothetical protein U0638_01905 [Phycisphaerales bacterium]
MEGPISSRNQDRHATRVDPSDVAHHLRVAADKYHELARHLLEQMNEAVAAVPDYRKNSIREGRESLAKLFGEQASDALRLANLFDDIDQVELLAALDWIAKANAKALAIEDARKARERLAAGTVGRPAEPAKFSPDAGHNELGTAVAAAGTSPACGCASCAEENFGSPQHTPTTWVGNELVNRQVGGAE